MPRQPDPNNPFDEKSVGLAAMGIVFFCAATGLGVGAFVEAPEVGGIAGLVCGIAATVLLLPRLMRDWH
jgi:hypothetical protein